MSGIGLFGRGETGNQHPPSTVQRYLCHYLFLLSHQALVCADVN